MHRRQLLRKKAIARHDEEDARLAEHHHQHDRGQGDEGGDSDEIADPLIADRSKDMRQGFARANQWLGYSAGDDCLALVGESDASGREGMTERIADRLRSHGADGSG